MSPFTQSLILWCFIVNLGTAFGAGLYEHRVVLPRWIRRAPDSGVHWRGDAARADDTGRRFWACVTTMPLTLLTLANLYAAWGATGALRGWWMAAAGAALLDRTATFGYFIPAMVRLLRMDDSAESAALAVRWSSLNHLRHVAVFAAWLAALRAFALFYAGHP